MGSSPLPPLSTPLFASKGKQDKRGNKWIIKAFAVKGETPGSYVPALQMGRLESRVAACRHLAVSEDGAGRANERPPPLPFDPPPSAQLSVEGTGEVIKSKASAEEWVVSSEHFFD